MSLKKTRLKAGAMSYAIILSIVVGALCMSLIWITTSYRNTRVSLKNKEKLVVNLLTGVKATRTLESFTEEKLLLINNDSVHIKKENWGLFNYFVVKARKNGRTLKRSFLSGHEIRNAMPALYLSNNDKALKLTGSTRITGSVFVPNGRVERGYIQGKNYEREKLVYGRVEESENSLPSIKEEIASKSIDEFVSFQSEVFLDQLPFDSIFEFDQPTNRFTQNIPISIDHILSGNLVIESKDSIFVSREAKLENVILKAPIIRFEQGFEGNVQVFAEQKIIIEKDVQLNYPSSICLIDTDKKFHRTGKAIVQMDEGSSVLGGVLVLSKSPDFRNLVKLKIENKSTIVGLVYNQGETMLKGKVIGSLFTKKLYIETKSSSYENHLLDAEIDATTLPDYFLLPSWMENDGSLEKRIKWL